MTFILGSRCSDGVVLVADRKMTITNEVQSVSLEYKPKLFGILRHVIFGSSGSTDTFEFFRDYVMDYVSSHKDVTIDNVNFKLAEIVSDIYRKHGFNRDLYFDLLVAVQHPTSPTTLTWISGLGSKRQIGGYHTVGIGGIFARPFLEKAWHTHITMERAAEIGYFIIKYVEEFRLHSSVGIAKNPPQIWFIPDNEIDNHGEKTDYEVSPDNRPEQFEKIKRNVLKSFKKYERQIGNLFNKTA
jgi:20S proteasome alpha/beta subunit